MYGTLRWFFLLVFFFFLSFFLKNSSTHLCSSMCSISPENEKKSWISCSVAFGDTLLTRTVFVWLRTKQKSKSKNTREEYKKLGNQRKKASRNLKTLALVICVFFLPNSVNLPSHETKESPLFPIPPCETKPVLVSYVLIPSSPRIVHSQELSKSENKMRAGSGDIKRTAKIQGTRPEGAYRHRSIREIELENQNTQPKKKKNRGWRIRPARTRRTPQNALTMMLW